VSAFRLMEAERARFCVPLMCRILGVSRSGYYAWKNRPPSARAKTDAAITEQIRHIHQRSRGTYQGYLRGSPHPRRASLRRDPLLHKGSRQTDEGGRHIRGCWRPRKKHTTTRKLQQMLTVPDLVERQFTPAAPERLWVADITYLRSWEGWLYLAFVLDAYSRRVVGWSMANRA
jgi:putative transposase